MFSINLELNVTLKCNCKCLYCNRCCNLFDYEDSDMIPEQIIKLGEQLKSKEIYIKKIKIVGGEPLLNPNIIDIVEELDKLKTEGLIGYIKINTNTTIPVPDGLRKYNMRWLGSSKKKKKHIPFPYSLLDCGLEPEKCNIPNGCGLSLDKWGFLPCSPAIPLVRILNKPELYSKTVPSNIYFIKELCSHCSHAMPANWKKDNMSFGLKDNNICPTKTMVEGIKKYNSEFDKKLEIY
ncbi:MAG: radical SAM protein [Nanoarchaeota archaeon]